MSADPGIVLAALVMAGDTLELIARECEDVEAATIANAAARQIRALLAPADPAS